MLRGLGRPLDGAAHRSHVDDRRLGKGKVGLAGRKGKVLVAEAGVGEAEGGVGAEGVGVRVRVRFDAGALGGAEVVFDVELEKRLKGGEAVVGRHQVARVKGLCGGEVVALEDYLVLLVIAGAERGQAREGVAGHSKSAGVADTGVVDGAARDGRRRG